MVTVSANDSKEEGRRIAFNQIESHLVNAECMYMENRTKRNSGIVEAYKAAQKAVEKLVRKDQEAKHADKEHTPDSD
jgi:hypothetical protein